MENINLQNFEIITQLKKDHLNKKYTYLLNIKEKEKELSNQAILIISKPELSEAAQKINLQNLQDLNFFHSNKPFYKFHFDFIEKPDNSLKFEAELIYPIDQKILNKYSKYKITLIAETPEMYQNFQATDLKNQINRLGWIDQIAQGLKEQDKIILREDDFFAVYDYKFNPELQQKESLHILAIVTDKNLTCLRDLKGENLGLLKNIKSKVTAQIEKKFEISEKELYMFIHYQPSFYRLHIHFIHVENKKEDILGDRAHFLDNVISNLELDENYYLKSKILIRNFEVQKEIISNQTGQNQEIPNKQLLFQIYK